MFTGLVEDVGQVVAAERRGDSIELVIQTTRIPAGELALGDSVAIDGTCLTVTALEARGFRALAGPETMARTTLGELQVGYRVNLERALRVGDRLGGHIVQGHVDGVGSIVAKQVTGPAIDITISVPAGLTRYMIEKGSVAVDGISLTINAVDSAGFRVAIIPHTQDMTTLTAKAVGARVNLEVDEIAKYVEKLVMPHRREAE